MRNSSHFDKYRNTTHPTYGSTAEDGQNGFFVVPLSKSLSGMTRTALCIVGAGNEDIPWEHVSVRISEGRGKGYHDCPPTWMEMCAIKELFWGDDEVVMQVHPEKKNYINFHPCVLHLWKPLRADIPLPPLIAV